MTATAHAELPGRRTDAVGRDSATPGFHRRVDAAWDSLMDDARYDAWRQTKLQRLRPAQAIAVVPLADPRHLSATEHRKIRDQIEQRNFAIYQVSDRCNQALLENGGILESLCQQFGLTTPVGNPAADSSGVSRIESVDARSAVTRARYIPYTNRKLNWHTDGYYNDEASKIRSFALHCVRRAGQGGENAFLDPEMLYLMLRDEFPASIPVLCRHDAFTIPADPAASGCGREGFTGPVFSTDPITGVLYTRYTQRKRHIHWLDTPDMLAALNRIEQILQGSHPAITRLTLEPGQGILCNNVLHCRTAFEDHPDTGQGRLLYRLRFNQRITTQGIIAP